MIHDMIRYEYLYYVFSVIANTISVIVDFSTTLENKSYADMFADSCVHKQTTSGSYW